ncbi:conserved hypothetical protein [Mycoplasmopsis pulmonis]|uniref:Segregation and condensation protein A n=1 Tax=Mycoplasmopsis pulmonis (strain UAB CTIP) TaxID=272635 RepID=SCPA_MYCPU|nr:segregation/condensation protein A [Mycoplasmopsis pulmonis]Q98R95.1 RecName: Full=Segregation and condensation protein A [Mycoplasmopsis pulmonis UAB CTIP]MDZ7293085.1 segregation/condensation protein A [Mycoplasmopsis pulmonis]CAC13288.1 conserved hypothetical protein [Mycoplasmopsis pulmonis]VEU67878.1 segregation and condensation protein A [Mycoplasmopsis pulmonis]
MQTSLHENGPVFNIKNFSGPLDLLLSLVKDKNIDIFEINLVELATQYLEIIKKLQDDKIDLASDYLVMAATLLQIKASMALQGEKVDEEVELDKERLLMKLAEYKQFKEISQILRYQEEKRKEIFLKKSSPAEEFIRPIDEKILDGRSSMVQLVLTLRQMFERTFAEKLRRTKIDNFNLTPSDQVLYIKKLFNENEIVTFEMIFSLPSLSHFVITLIALLDLSRRQELLIYQDQQFGTIRIEKGPNYEE